MSDVLWAVPCKCKKGRAIVSEFSGLWEVHCSHVDCPYAVDVEDTRELAVLAWNEMQREPKPTAPTLRCRRGCVEVVVRIREGVRMERQGQKALRDREENARIVAALTALARKGRSVECSCDNGKWWVTVVFSSMQEELIQHGSRNLRSALERCVKEVRDE